AFLEKEADVMGARALQLRAIDYQVSNRPLHFKKVAQLSSDSDENALTLAAAIQQLDAIVAQVSSKENEDNPDLAELKSKILTLKEIQSGTDTDAKRSVADTLRKEFGLLSNEGISIPGGAPVQLKQEGTVYQLNGKSTGKKVAAGIAVAAAAFGVAWLVRRLIRRRNAQAEPEEDEVQPLSDDLIQGVAQLVRFGKVDENNNIIERIQAANRVHQKVFDLLDSIVNGVKTYMQGSGGQVQNALSLIGQAAKSGESNQTLENMVYNFCAVYNPGDLDFSDIDILVPVESTASHGTDTLLRIKQGLLALGGNVRNPEIRSAAVLGGNSSFSHIFLQLNDQDIDIVIQDQRFAEFFAPRLPHMAARADIQGNPGFIRTVGAGQDDDSEAGFSDLTDSKEAEAFVTEHMRGGLTLDADLDDKSFDFQEVQDKVREQILAFRAELSDPAQGVNKGELLGETMNKLIGAWVKKKKNKSQQIADELTRLEQDEKVESADKVLISESTEFRKNQKQYYKSAKMTPDPESTAGSLAHKKSVVAFYHMLAKHLDPGDVSADNVADFTASLMAKKGFADKSGPEKVAWLNDQIAKLASVHTYFEALIQMEWAQDDKKVANAAVYFLKQQAIYVELAVRIQFVVDQGDSFPVNASDHLKERAYEREITPAEISAAIASGDEYDDPDYKDSTVYYLPATGVSVCKIGDNYSTCYKSDPPRPKDKWILRKKNS
ncbi:MAG: DUF4258 domain-containing protein, partial [Bacteroidota bacterium]